MPTTTTAPHRLTLSAAEYSYLVARTGLSMPPQWEPLADTVTGAEEGSLAKRGVLTGHGDLLSVHPSIDANLRILAGPRIMLDTTATIGARGSRSLHAIGGQLGASLFLLPDAGIELSMFSSVDLGRELVRAVPAEEASIGSTLDESPAAPLRGTVPLEALHELGIASLLRDADPGAASHVLATLKLPEAEAALATEAARRTDGVLSCLVTARIGSGIRTGQVTWLHTDAGWVGVAPSTSGADRKLVDLTPVDRAELGVWVTPFVAEALA